MKSFKSFQGDKVDIQPKVAAVGGSKSSQDSGNSSDGGNTNN